MYIHRVAEDKFQSLTGFFKVVLLTGPRQFGKTTMLQHLASGTERTYVTLDDPNVRALAKADPLGFFQTFPPPILIDEVQYAPELFPVIKLLADASDVSGQFWLTGSQHYHMLRNVQESLAGRIGIMSLTGMTQGERQALGFEELRFDLTSLRSRASRRRLPVDSIKVAEHIWRGAMPGAPVPGAAHLRNVFFESYVQSYLMRDVAQIGGVQHLETFSRFLTACAALIGQQLNLTRLAEAAGVSNATAKDWLALLSGMGVVFLLRPYTSNVLKRLAKRPKLYFADTGLAAYLTAWPTPETLWQGAMSGAFFENYVLTELTANSAASADPFQLSYFRDGNGKEIDIVLHRHGVYHPLEIKQAVAPRRQEVKKFSVLERAGAVRGAGGIICMAPEPMLISSQDHLIPSVIL